MRDSERVSADMGGVLRLLAEILGDASNLYGFEFSKNRLGKCKQLSPAITYQYGDVTSDFGSYTMAFNGISCFDVLSHLRQDTEIKSALKNYLCRR